MKPGADTPFLELPPSGIAALARDPAAGIAPDYTAAVTENLRLLQHHAGVVAAALRQAGAQASDAAFEP
jgi:hypothetical protein